jgi:outer membrane protein assembly factor BamE (lipoprotein component of BamABCDE complex)
MRRLHRLRSRLVLVALAAAIVAAACDQQKIQKLEEGVSTEADVRRQFGEPAAVYQEAGGARTLEYPRQPEGQANYMITIGADGKMSALRQVLRPDIFARVTPGLDKAQVRRLIGMPAKTQRYELKKEEAWDWRYQDGTEARVFVVTFDEGGRVVSTATMADPRVTEAGGPSR